MKQHEAVILTMKKHDGYATLGLLYQEVLKVPGVTWTTKTPFKSISRIVQTREEFFRIRPGLWGLKEYRDSLPPELIGSSETSQTSVTEFNHTYFQGLLVQIGNWRQRETFVPTQDRNRKFLNTPLSEMASLKVLYSFGYEEFVKRSSTIDVIWFNERRMPEAAFEVEHTTDIQNSLLKFFDLRDYRMRNFIVADVARKKEFITKLNYEAFKPIQKYVEFLSYDDLSELHTITGKQWALTNRTGF